MTPADRAAAELRLRAARQRTAEAHRALVKAAEALRLAGEEQRRCEDAWLAAFYAPIEPPLEIPPAILHELRDGAALTTGEVIRRLILPPSDHLRRRVHDALKAAGFERVLARRLYEISPRRVWVPAEQEDRA